MNTLAGAARTHHTYCEFHLGDNLAFLHLLRSLAREMPGREFVHFAHLCYIPQLREAVCDLTNIRLADIEKEERLAGTLDVWKNADGFWQHHPRKNNYPLVTLEYYQWVCRRMGYSECPLTRLEQLSFDYPAIQHPRSMRLCEGRFPFLIVNSAPCSGQAMRYDRPGYYDPLIKRLVEKHGQQQVIVTQPSAEASFCTHDWQLSISDIGNLSLRADHIIGVSTGPIWPTFNIWNRDTVKLRAIQLDTETMVGLAPNVVHYQTLEECMALLEQRGLL